MNLKEALEQIEKEKKTSEPLSLLFKTLETAHPDIKKVFETRSAEILMAAAAVGKGFSEASKTEAGKKEIEKHFARLRSMASAASNDFEEEEDDDTPAT